MEARVIDQAIGERYALYNADCMEVARALPSASVHYSIFSPPFGGLMYTYSASPRDVGNCTTQEEFAEQFAFLPPELLRITKPGRLASLHCMNLPTSKARDGYIGLEDFRGDLIRAFQKAGWIYHSEVCIWKDPVTAVVRTKALGLLHKQIKKDSAMSRMGLPDYLVTFRKPGENEERITHSGEGVDMPIPMWQRYASPIWVTRRGEDDEGFAVCSGEPVAGDDTSSVDPGDTLQHKSAREATDEKHIAPLQKEVIRRGVKLWSNPGDTVFTPFAGIGSELVVSLEMGRRAVGSELKRSYFEQAARNCASVVETPKQVSLFGAFDAPMDGAA